MGFQTQVNTSQAPAVAGDFASSNPRTMVLAGPGGLVSGLGGLTVGRFAWVDPGNLSTTLNEGAGAPTGFVYRNQQASITTFLAEASMVIVEGQQVGLLKSGDVWVKNDGATVALVGQRAYARFADGKVSFAAAAAALTASATGSIAAGSGSATGIIQGNLMTLTASLSGSFHPGCPVTGTNVATGTKITRQISGTANGLGVYEVTPGYQDVESTTISETHGVFTAASGLSGTFEVGSVLSGSGGGGVDDGQTIVEFGTGTGGLGTYYTSITETVTSTTITGTTNVDTQFVAATYGNPGDLVKISGPVIG